MAVIFVLSSIPDLRSGLQPLWDAILRKFAHAAEYAVLSWLFFRALRQPGLKNEFAAVLSIGFSVLYAASDELHQAFVPGRHGAPLDMVIDTLGAGMAMILITRKR